MSFYFRFKMVLIMDYLCSIAVIRLLFILCWLKEEDTPTSRGAGARRLHSPSIQYNCVYERTLRHKILYNITSEDYPKKYHRGTKCLYTVTSRKLTRIALLCRKFYIPESDDCSEDAVRISKSGNKQFRDAYTICGAHRFVYTVSDSNKIAMDLLAAEDSAGGKFQCSFRVIKADKVEYCQCGAVNESPALDGRRVAKSEPTEPGQYPCVAALLDKTKNRVFGSATILSMRFAITTANTLQHQPSRTKALLVTGVHNILDFEKRGKGKNGYAVKSYHIHPEYNMLSAANNIALVKTVAKMTFDSTVGPVCLPGRIKPFSFYNLDVTALGWEKRRKRNITTEPLKHVTLRVVSLEACRKDFRVSSKELCTQPFAFDRLGCNYVPGGPILFKDIGRVYLLGLQTFLLCENKAISPHTAVKPYLDWIKKRVRGGLVC